jgi:rubredoxin
MSSGPPPGAPRDDDRVLSPFGCPQCGERRSDYLVWTEDESVRCATCGTVYSPDGPSPEA